MLKKGLFLAYAGVVYGFFLGTFLYAMGFVSNLVVPKSIDSGPAAPLWEALLINGALLLAFAVQHTIMARASFKRWWTQYVPKPIERSTFVLVASALLALLMWQWRSLPALVWEFEADWARVLLTVISLAGWALVLYSSFLIDHFDLFGLRQVWLYARGRAYTAHPFVERSVYKHVRHPLMLGFLIAFWSTPAMSVGHLFFAVLITVYVLVGVRIEERDLVRYLGDAYVRYRERTPSLIPRLWRRREKDAGEASLPAVETADVPSRTTKHGVEVLGLAGLAFFTAKGLVWLGLAGAAYFGLWG